jgi:hypothetical protein
LSRHVDDFVSEVGTLKTKVTATEGTVADAKSVADEVNQWKQRGIGALFVRQIASAAVSGSRRLCGLLVGCNPEGTARTAADPRVAVPGSSLNLAPQLRLRVVLRLFGNRMLMLRFFKYPRGTPRRTRPLEEARRCFGSPLARRAFCISDLADDFRVHMAEVRDE